MVALLVFALLIALIFGLGFAIKWLFILAALLAVVWLLGFFANGPEARWYRW
jgi:hypothetical protein